ncbi:hypothetical protein ERJ75_000898600 [Trypanosoma vivax]|nr:hypothetical protein ERJ75_000898600 [Trypanosoma vivax]
MAKELFWRAAAAGSTREGKEWSGGFREQGSGGTGGGGVGRGGELGKCSALGQLRYCSECCLRGVFRFCGNRDGRLVGRLGRQCRGEVKREGETRAWERRDEGQGGVGGVKRLGETALAGWVPEVKALAGEGKQGKSYATAFCTCAFFLAAASVAALAADPGPGSNAAEFAVLCGAYRAAKAVQDSAERMRAEIESLEAVGREGQWSKRQEDQEAVTELARHGRRRSATRSPRAVAESLAKLAERYAMQAIYGSEKAGMNSKVPDAEDETNALLTMLRGIEDTNGGFDEEATTRGSSCR